MAARTREPKVGNSAIRSDESYPLQFFQRAVGLNAKSMRQARRAGLRVIRCHSRAYVLGADWLDYLKRLAELQSKGVEA